MTTTAQCEMKLPSILRLKAVVFYGHKCKWLQSSFTNPCIHLTNNSCFSTGDYDLPATRFSPTREQSLYPIGKMLVAPIIVMRYRTNRHISHSKLISIAFWRELDMDGMISFELTQINATFCFKEGQIVLFLSFSTS